MSQAYRSLGIARFTRHQAAIAGGAILVAMLVSALPASAEPTTPEGIWYTSGDESIIRVHPCTTEPGEYCGTLVWLKEPNEANGQPKADTLNRDPAKKGRPMIGVDILTDMKAADNRWKGHAYNPEDGKIYDITFKVKTDKEENDTADLRGCVLGFLCKTETFTRASNVPGGDPTLGASVRKKSNKSSAHR